MYGLKEENWNEAALSLCVVGASGDLAKKKIFPALFALYYEGHLPKARAPRCPGVAALPAPWRDARPARARLLLALTRVCCPACPPHSWQNFAIFGYARSRMSDAEFRELISFNLTCRLNDTCVRGFGVLLRLARPAAPCPPAAPPPAVEPGASRTPLTPHHCRTPCC